MAGDRRDHFSAETQLKKLAAGFIREELEPHISSGEERIERLKRSLADMSNSSEQQGSEAFYDEQIKQLGRWHTKGSRLLPFITRFLE